MALTTQTVSHQTKEVNIRALIDADWFAYAFGNATDDEYKPLAWPFVKSRIDGTIRKILEATEAETHQLYITSNERAIFDIVSPLSSLTRVQDRQINLTITTRSETT